MDRLAEMDEYDSMFGRRLVDDDFLAAGYTPQEVQAYRGSIVQPSLTAQDRAAMEAQYGTLQAPDYTMRQTAANRAQDRMISEGMDPYVAGLYSRRIFGDTAPTDGGLGIGLADLTPLGAIFGVQEGARTARSGYEQGDPLQMGLGALEAGLGILEATPLTKAIGRGIAATARRMDPNTLYSVFGPPGGTRSPLRAPETGGGTTGIRAYHGSPHDFDRFSMDKIGTGEGAQAYGHGLYFAESEGVARSYRDQLSPAMIDGREVDYGAGSDLAASWFTAFNDRVKAADYLQRQIDNPPKSIPNLRPLEEIAAMRDAISLLRSDAPIGKTAPAGKMYEVEVNANPEDFLDWDAPLSAQPQGVREVMGPRVDALRAVGAGLPEDPIGEALWRAAHPQGGFDKTDFSRSVPEQATERLREAGIPGIRYLDAGSRGAGAGSRNYVVFDENLISIVRKYGIAGAAAMLGVSALDVEQAIAQNLPPSEWDRVLVGPQ